MQNAQSAVDDLVLFIVTDRCYACKCMLHHECFTYMCGIICLYGFFKVCVFYDVNLVQKHWVTIKLLSGMATNDNKQWDEN